MAVMVGLPWYGTSFVVVPETELLARLVGDHRVLTVLGPGGAGKTRLVVEAVPSVVERYERGVFVDVSAGSGATTIAELVAETIGAPVRGSEPLDAVESVLGGRRTLLVLDSCEFQIGACADLVHQLVGRLPDLDVLCTSRQPLGLDGEVHVRLGSLRERGPALFVDRARLADPTFAPTATDVIASICDATEGLPLAIELAAAQLGHLSLSEIATGVTGRVHLLEREASKVTGRHRSMRACVDWSLDLLADDERRALRLLSVFDGSFDAAALEVVLELDRAAAARMVSRLVARSLLVATDAPSGRFRMLDVVREVATAERRSSDDQDAAVARHLQWAVQRCISSVPELEGAGLLACVRTLLHEATDVSSAFDRAVARSDLDSAEAMFASLALLWITSGRFAQADRWFRACRNLATARPLHPRTNWTAALVAVYAGRRQDAVELATEALGAARSTGDDLVAARALDVLGFAALPVDATSAEAVLLEAAVGAEAAGDPWCHADAMQIAGYASIARGRPVRASAHLLQARPVAERLRHPQLLAWDGAGIALVDALMGRFRRAAVGLEDARCHADATGDPNITGSLIAFRAHVAVYLDETAPWAAAVDEALHRCVRLGAGQGTAELVVARIELALVDGDEETANDLWFRSAGPLGVAAPEAHRRLSHVGAAAALASGDAAAARKRLLSVGSRPSAATDALTEMWLALSALRGDELIAARRHLRRASDDAVAPEALVQQHDLALVWAALIAAEGDDGRAAEVFDAAGGHLVGDAVAGSSIARLVMPRLAHLRASAAAGSGDPRRAIVIARTNGHAGSARFGWAALTPTEHKVAALAVHGLTNRAIAERLGCSPGTVKSHLEHIYAKTGIANRTELAAERARLKPSSPP